MAADTPRAYLERCIERIEALEPAVMAFAFLNLDRARKAADESGARYKSGQPLSAVDGMPVGIKDLIETYDMPTEYGSELFRGHQPMTDAASRPRVAPGRRGAGRQDRHGVLRRRRSGAHAQSVRHPPHAGRLVERHRRGGRLAHAAGRARHPRARLDHPAGELLRRLCAEAHLRRDQPPGLVLDGLQHGPSRRVRRHAVRHVDHGAHHREPRRRRSVASRPLRRDRAAGAAQARAAHPSRHRRLAGRRARRQGCSSRLISRGSLTQASRSSPAATIRRSRPTRPRTPARRSSGPISTASRCTGRCCNTASATATRCRRACSRASRMARTSPRRPIAPRWPSATNSGRCTTNWRSAPTASSRCRRPAPARSAWTRAAPIFNEASSVLGAPAINLPLLAVDRAPLGVQLLGRWHEDERLTAAARWLAETHFGNPA